MKKIQKVATAWFYDYQDLYKKQLLKRRLLPLSLYIEHDVWYLLDFMSGNYEFDFSRHLQTTLSTITRQYNRNELVVWHTRLKRCDEQFMYLSSHVYNILSRLAEEWTRTLGKFYPIVTGNSLRRVLVKEYPALAEFYASLEIATPPKSLKTTIWLESYKKNYNQRSDSLGCWPRSLSYYY